MTAAVYTIDFDTGKESLIDMPIADANRKTQEYLQSIPCSIQLFGRESIVDNRTDKSPPIFIFSEGFTSCVCLIFVDPITRSAGMYHIFPYASFRDKARVVEDMMASNYSALGNAHKMLPSPGPDTTPKILFLHGYSMENSARLTRLMSGSFEARLREDFPAGDDTVVAN